MFGKRKINALEKALTESKARGIRAHDNWVEANRQRVMALGEAEAVRGERDEARAALDRIGYEALPGLVTKGELLTSKNPGAVADATKELNSLWWREKAARAGVDAERDELRAAIQRVSSSALPLDLNGKATRRLSVGATPAEVAESAVELLRDWQQMRRDGRSSDQPVEPRVFQEIQDVPEGVKVEDKTADGDRWWWEGDTLIYQCTEVNGDVMDAEPWDGTSAPDRYAPFTEVAA